MSHIHSIKKISAIAIMILSSCDKDFSSLENADTIERLTGGSLCKNSKVILKNKYERFKNINDDSMRFIINSSPGCIEKFSHSIFSDSELQNCKINSGYSCNKIANNVTVSLFVIKYDSIELNIWS